MEHLEQLANLSSEEFIKQVKEHKEVYIPIINEQHYNERSGYHLTLINIAARLGEDAFEYVLREFWDIIDPNGGTHMLGMMGVTSNPMNTLVFFGYKRPIPLLASHPKYDVRCLIYYTKRWPKFKNGTAGLDIIENVIAIAKPIPMNYDNELVTDVCKQYSQDAFKTHKAMRVKHGYHIKDATQVFCLCLLITNKFFVA